MKELLRKAYEDGQLFGTHVSFEEYYREESGMIDLCIRDRDSVSIEKD
jgi:hypothetical protein